jgi:thioredoxin-related protein
MSILPISIAAIVVLLELVGSTPTKAQVEERIRWVSLDAAMDYSKRQNKMILVFISTEWCGWCKLMEKKTFQQKSVIQYMNEHFVAVRLDGLYPKDIWFKGFRFRYIPEIQAHQLAYQLLDGKLKYPSMVLMNYKAEVITPIYGYLEGRELVRVLSYYAEGYYETTPWEEYRRTRR